MIDTSFLDSLNRFSLIMRKRVTSNYIGTRKSIAHGKGTSFVDHRKYCPGDDFRSIDWTLFARTDRLHIKRYEEEKSLMTHVILDYSASMGYGKKISKFHYASMLGLGFAYLVSKENEKSQFSTFSDKLEVFNANKGSRNLGTIVNHLNKLKTGGTSMFRETMFKYKKMITSKSLLIVISDFLFDIDEIREGLYKLGNNEMKVIMILDKAEKDLELSGDLVLHDLETKSVMRTYVSPRLQHHYKGRLDDHIAKVAKICKQIGADFNLITTDMSIFDSFYEILKI